MKTCILAYLMQWHVKCISLLWWNTMSIANTWFSNRIKKRRVGGLLQLQQSEDQSVRDNVPELYTGRKWKIPVKASNIDSRIKMLMVMGNLQIGRTGLGYIKRRKMFNNEKQQNRREFLEVIRKAESESLYIKTVQQSV